MKIFEIKSIVHENGKHYKKSHGRILLTPQRCLILEDHHGLLGRMFPADCDAARGLSLLNRLGNNPYFSVKAQDEGLNYNDIKELPGQEKALDRDPVWLYTDHGSGEHHKIHYDGTNFCLNDQPLEDDALARLLESVHSGGTTLTYPDQEVMKNLKHIEDRFAPMTKVSAPDLSVEEVMKHLDSLTKDGQIPEGMTKVLRKHIFEHPMAPGVGNRYAWEQHKKRTQGLGNYYLVGDVNSFKHINDTLGHQTGDDTIVLLGKLIRETADEIGIENIKAFMPAGDEFIFATNSPEVAFVALRKMSEKMKAIPHVGGIHQLSATMGIGMSFVMADRAMYEAKKAKYHPMGVVVDQENQIDHHKSDRLFDDHAVPNLAYNLLPGQEGAIALE
jgi:GGDEF domain-containing protein